MNWKYKINIKGAFSHETSAEKIESLCGILCISLKAILDNSQKVLKEKSIDDVWYELELVKDNFEFLKQLCNGEIQESEWEDYNFDGDYKQIFNDYLEELYNVADAKITLKNGEINKFIWIG